MLGAPLVDDELDQPDRPALVVVDVHVLDVDLAGTGVGEEPGQLARVVGDGDRPSLEAVLGRGLAGTRAIPGKHGGPARPTTSVFVSIPDSPGALARLFADADASGVNIEDLRIDHDPGRATGLLELLVDEERAEHLLASLEARDWVTHR